MARQRLTEDFVRYLKLLKEQTGNSQDQIKDALNRNPQLAVTIEELQKLWFAIKQHENFSKRRFIVQAHPEFHDARIEYEQRWSGAWSLMQDWKDERAGRESITQWLIRELAEPPNPPVGALPEIDEEWEFDPGEHSAASLVESMAEYFGDKSDDGAYFCRAHGAYKWLTETIGVDLYEIEKRWREIGVLVVPEHVSNHHGLTEPKSLFAYLDNVRNAYLFGADLAAIAMCRATTEMLLRNHYSKDEKSRLTALTERIQSQPSFVFLRPFNLVSKIREANRLLHVERTDIEVKEHSKALIREWVAALKEMIVRAPLESAT